VKLLDAPLFDAQEHAVGRAGQAIRSGEVWASWP